jgi:predicted small integral membrane protein
MPFRLSKILLIAAIAFYYTLVVFNNVTDYASNYQFVEHVLRMDSTFPGNRAMWRAIRAPWVHVAFYDSIIFWEFATALVTWAGAVRLLRAAPQPAKMFDRAKGLAAAGLTAGLLMWLVAFLSVGGEWFLMWQSRTWNGQETAFHISAALGIVLTIVLLPDAELDAV